MHNYYLKFLKFVKQYQDPIFIVFVTFFFMLKFIFFPDLFQAAYLFIKKYFFYIYQAIKEIFKK